MALHADLELKIRTYGQMHSTEQSQGLLVHLGIEVITICREKFHFTRPSRLAWTTLPHPCVMQ